MKNNTQPVRILAIGAHPDDLEFGMGGVLLKEFDAGAEICMAITSLGESASHGSPELRKSEAMAAAKRVGAGERLRFLDFGGDGQQRATQANAIQVAGVIREFKPSIVFAPVPASNQHPDHAAVGAAARDACRLARYGGLAALELPAHPIDSLWFYAVTSIPDLELRGAVLVDISAVVDRWQELMKCHGSQVTQRRYLDLQVARARQFGLMAGCDYATALWPNDPPVIQGIQALPRTARGF